MPGGIAHGIERYGYIGEGLIPVDRFMYLYSTTVMISNAFSSMQVAPAHLSVYYVQNWCLNVVVMFVISFLKSI